LNLAELATQHTVAVICRTLRMARIRAVTNSRATDGYRRVWVMVNRTFRAGYNRKRIRRLMRMHAPFNVDPLLPGRPAKRCD